MTDDDWQDNGEEVYGRAEDVCDSPGVGSPYLEVTLDKDTSYVVFGGLWSSIIPCSEYTALDLTPTTSIPFVTTIRVTEVDGVPVGGRKKAPARKTPAKRLSPAELEAKRKQKQARAECLRKPEQPAEAIPAPAKTAPKPAKTAPKKQG